MNRWRLAAAALVACGCRQDPVAAPHAPAGPGPDARMVTVESRPSGAEVLVGGPGRCRTPCSFRVDPGHYRLTLRLSGYMPWETELVVEPGADPRVDASLVPSH